MGVPQIYRRENENTFINFDFTDVANGLGYETYYAVASVVTPASGGTTYHLVPQNIYSGAASISGAGDGASGDTEYNFDSSTFNLPRTVSGNAYITFTINASGDHQHRFKLYKYDGSSETALSSQISTADENSGADEERLVILPLTETIIKSGDLLRLEINITDEAGGDALYLGSQDSKPLSIRIPFKVDP